MKTTYWGRASALLAGMIGNEIAHGFVMPDSGFFETVGIHTACVIALLIPLTWFGEVIDFFLEWRKKSDGLG